MSTDNVGNYPPGMTKDDWDHVYGTTERSTLLPKDDLLDDVD